jgi:hypothetical protein
MNAIKNNGKKKDQMYPTLIHDNEIKEDFDKANLFGSILRQTFQDNNTSKFDQNF